MSGLAWVADVLAIRWRRRVGDVEPPADPSDRERGDDQQGKEGALLGARFGAQACIEREEKDGDGQCSYEPHVP